MFATLVANIDCWHSYTSGNVFYWTRKPSAASAHKIILFPTPSVHVDTDKGLSCMNKLLPEH